MPSIDTVSLEINGVAWSGWERVRISRGIERMPSDFSVTASERSPDEALQIVIAPGQAVTLKIGNDVVITGYIDRYMQSIDARSRTVEVTGRGKCQDIVDCSAEFAGQQVQGATALGISKVICLPFGITVSSPVTDLRPIYQFNTVLTETGYSVIERITRYSGVVAYEGRDGNLILARVPNVNQPLPGEEMASGFEEGVNVQSMRGMLSMDQRFSEVRVIRLANNEFQTEPGGAPFVVGILASNSIYPAFDKTVPRYRPRIVMSEQSDNEIGNAQLRANWEIARRYGRSQAVTLTCDSWRASDGQLWEVNKLVSMDLPGIKMPGRKWLITEVTFSKDLNQGTTAEITLMPPQAFTPEPILLYPFDVQLANDLAASKLSSDIAASKAGL